MIIDYSSNAEDGFMVVIAYWKKKYHRQASCLSYCIKGCHLIQLRIRPEDYMFTKMTTE